MKLLIKEDPELGYAYFCPACKRFLCSSADYCIFCGQPLDWEAEKVPYNGRVKWPTTEELEMAYHRKPEGGCSAWDGEKRRRQCQGRGWRGRV